VRRTNGNNMNKRVLITGGAGFLGSHVCSRHVAQGHDVYCLDNLQTGHTLNIEALNQNQNFQFIHHDVIDPLNLEVDEIYHLACPASPPQYQKNPVNTAKVSFLGTLNMLELAQKNKAKIFFASTSEVYGDPEQHPQTESYRGCVNTIGPRACYDEGKRIAETLCFDFIRMYGLNVKVARFFNTYGPNMDPEDGRVVSNFIVQSLLGRDLTVYGEGQQTRSFCYVDDLVNAMLLFMAQPADISGPINLGNPVEFTILELANQVLELTGSTSKLLYFPLPIDDPRQRCPDISLARQLLGWQPRTPLREGLVETIKYFRLRVNPVLSAKT